MPVSGTQITTTNNQLRFYIIIFGSLIAFGSIFYWRQQTFKQAEFVEFPQARTARANAELRSKNFQLEVQDASPTAK